MSSAKKSAGKRSNIRDSIFFAKEDIHIGTKLVNRGSLYYGTTWEVIGITSYDLLEDGSYKKVKVSEVRKQTDDVKLKRIGNIHEVREMAFSGLCYSAIWRLA